MSCAIWLHVLSFGISVVLNDVIELSEETSEATMRLNDVIEPREKTSEATITEETTQTSATTTEATTRKSRNPATTRKKKPRKSRTTRKSRRPRKSRTTRKSGTTIHTTIEPDSEYQQFVNEYCISYDDDCEQSLVMLRLSSQEHSASYSKGILGQSQLLTKLTRTEKPTDAWNPTTPKIENSRTYSVTT